MKHTEETKKKISETLKRKGIKPTVLPSKEQCIKNLEKTRGKDVWNKGKKGLQIAWNKGVKMREETKQKIKETMFKKGHIPHNYKGKPFCLDCGIEISRHNKERCIKCFGKNNSGKNHYAWKGGAKTEILRIRTSTEYKSWRLDVYKRDWFTCQVSGCGYKGKDIEAHHIKKVKKYPELILDVNNGITLCKKCHLSIRNKEKQYETLFQEIVNKK